MTQGSESTRSGSRTIDSVLDRFEHRARDTPEARALIAGSDSLTYGQLEARANQLAHHLLDAGLPRGGLVALGTARQAELLVALLGVLKAGGHCAVIDVETSGTGQRRLSTMEPFAVLTHAAHQARLDDGRGMRFIRLGAEASTIAARPADPPARTLGDAALLTFTGGPEPRRPVVVTHAALLDAYEAWAEVARLTPEDRHLITADPDVTSFATGWTRALCSGGALVLAERGRWTAGAIRRRVEAAQVTVVHTDPAGAAQLLLRDAEAVTARERREPDGALSSLRLVSVTGDRLFLDEQAALQARLRAGARLLNVYGLAETAGTGAWFELAQLPRPQDDPERHALIGTPFPGYRVDLRDGEIRLTPPGGEDALPTGDLAELRPDGLLEFRGRRRHRIVLDDGNSFDPHAAEGVIRGHAHIGAVLVAAVPFPGTSGATRLVAYVTPPADDLSEGAGAGLPDVDGLREHLKGKLPPWQTPRAVIRLRTLPRSRAGQENRDAVPQPPRLTDPVEAVPRGGKYAAASSGPVSGPVAALYTVGCAALLAAVAGGFLLLPAKVLWPGSTDLTGVPGPWAFLFFVLYLFEGGAFAAGLLFLFTGRRVMLRQGRGRGLTTAAHLAVVYLLAAWWPQDNFYRLAAKTDWPLQAALVYTFNIPLMIAAGVVAAYVTQKPASPFDSDD